MPFNLGTPEIILILIVVLIVFGVGKLPQVGSALGKSIREFHKAKEGEDEGKIKAAVATGGKESQNKS